MLLFSWKKIKVYSRGSAKKAIRLLQLVDDNHLFNPHPTTFEGHSFLVNNKTIYRRDISSQELLEYIILASRRSLADYLLTGDKTLDERLATFTTKCKLITTKDGRIHFADEER